MPPPFYTINEEQAGFRYSGTAWTQYGPPLSSTTGNPDDVSIWLSAAATVQGDPLKLYVVRNGTRTLYRSTDGGATWTVITMGGLPATCQIFSLWARADGELLLHQGRRHTSYDGIWRSTDNALNWTRIIAFDTGPGGTTAFRSGYLALGLSKMFYARCTSQSASGATRPHSATWTFNRCNFDGTGIETWATVTLTETQDTLGNWGRLPNAFVVHAYGDDLMLVASAEADQNMLDSVRGVLWKIDASGQSDVRPGGIAACWELLPLTATRWLAVGTPSLSSTEVRVYRTDNAGGSWSLTHTIASTEGFAFSGAPDSYYLINVSDPSVPDDVVMLGHAGSSVQQIVWTSEDGGGTWASMVNTAEPIDIFGDWTVLGPGGLATIAPYPVVVTAAIPARLATIVG
jgi:hypothetical protein